MFSFKLELTHVFLLVKQTQKQEEGKKADGGEGETADGGEEATGGEVADVSRWALGVWCNGPLNRLRKYYRARLRSDGNYPHNDDWQVSDSGESNSSSDDSYCNPEPVIAPHGFDSDA